MIDCKKVLTALFAVLISNVAQAAAWSEVTTVTAIQTTDLGKIFVRFGDMVDQSCPSINWITLSSDNVMYKEIYASLLTAKLTNSTVKYYVAGCIDSYPKLMRVWMY